MIDNTLKIDEVLTELYALREQNEDLKLENDFLQQELTHFKAKSLACMQRCRTLGIENESLKSEIADLKFTRKYLTSEEAGRQFAKELLGGA